MPITHAPYRAFLKTSTAITAAALLAACGGGGGGGGDDVVSASEVNPALTGQADLPYFLVDGDGGTSGNVLYRGDGSTVTVTIVDSDTIEFTSSEGGAPSTIAFNYNPSSGFWELATNTDFKFVMLDRGDYQGFYLAQSPSTGPFAPFAQSGGFGLPTDTGLTGSATFSSNTFARILLTDDDPLPGDPPYFSISSSDGVNLTVTDLNNGAISGTVFDGSGLFDLDEDDAFDDRLNLTVSMTGNISGAAITGTVSGGPVTADLNDNGSIDDTGTLTLNNTELDGAFFGDGAEWVAGSWEADYSLAGSEGDPFTGDAIGFFEAQQTPD